MTSNDIKWLLRQRYCPPEYAICFEVANGTGAYQSRFLDAITMSLYPSRGLHLYGFEIKTSRSDLKREIDTPDKAEKVAQFLDHFFVVYPDELKILDLEIPPGWGLMSASLEKGLRIVKHPELISSIAPSKSFIAALFRAKGIEDEYMSNKKIESKIKELESSFESRVRIASDTYRSDRSTRSIWMEDFVKEMEADGITWREIQWNGGLFAQAVKDAFFARNVVNLERIAEELEDSAKQIRKELKIKYDTDKKEALVR